VTTLSQIPGLQQEAQMVEAVRAQYLGQLVGADGAPCPSKRRAAMAARLALYRDDFKPAVEKLIETIWTHPTVQTDRKRFAELVGFLNVPKRVVDEVASLYDQPAKRTFANEAETVRFQAVEKALNLHQVMKEAHRLSFWLNNVLLWQTKRDGKLALRIITPDAFDVVVNPADPLEMVAVIIDCAPAWVPATVVDRSTLPYYEVWDSEVMFKLNADGHLIGDVTKHELGRIPGVLLSSRLPVDRLLDDRPGRDIEAAARAVMFLNLLLLNLAHTSGEQQPYFKGNLGQIAADQPQSAGRPLGLPPDVDAGVLDLVTDPEHLLKSCRHTVSSIAQAYGMSYEQFTFTETADTASGKAYTVRRQKLTELRQEQRGRADVHEPQVVELVFGTAEGLRVDYHDQGAPLDPIEDFKLFVDRMNRGMDNPIEKMKRENPDLTDAEAQARLVKNVAIASWFFALLRANNISMNATTANPGQPPEANGAMAQNPAPGATATDTRTGPAGDTTATAA
jgi:hypothetical protein